MPSGPVSRILPIVVLLSACASSRPDTASTPTAIEPSGQRAYESFCAGCHDSGADGAPRTGDPAAWRDRSALWEAVLFEHAKSGYFDMPARGGNATLPDRTVEAAAEYMLSITHPELSPDGD